jgi:hypothetical protein
LAYCQDCWQHYQWRVGKPAQNQLQILSDRLRNQQQRQKKLVLLGASALLSCGLAELSLRASGRNSDRSITTTSSSNKYTTMASISAASAALVTSYSGYALYKNYYSAEIKSVDAVARLSHSAYSATVYEDADSVWNILKSFSMLIVKEGKHASAASASPAAFPNGI